MENRDVKELKRVPLTYEEFEKALNDFDLLLGLTEEYEKSTMNRKVFASVINSKIKELKDFSHHLEMDLMSYGNEYARKGYYITDYNKLFNILLRIANKDEDKFEVKTFKNDKSIYERVDVLGNKEVLNSIDLDSLYKMHKLCDGIDKIVDGDSSVIVVSDHYREHEYKPFDRNDDDLDKFDLLVEREPVGIITCFLKDDELKDAVYKYLSYARDNGADIKGIDEDYLYNIINKEDKIKRLVK